MSEGIKLTEDEIHPPGRLLRVARKDSLLCLSIVRWDISLALNMTVLFIPYRRRCRHFPRRRKRVLFYCLCERSEANSREGRGLRSMFSVLFQGDCRGRYAPSQ